VIFFSHLIILLFQGFVLNEYKNKKGFALTKEPIANKPSLVRINLITMNIKIYLIIKRDIFL
jgi:hypothetical protein